MKEHGQKCGDRKLFTLDDFTTILWKENKNVLCIHGARANKIMQRLCELMCSFEAPISDTRQPSVQSSVVCETLVDLQQGQLVNLKEIQALPGTIAHITSMMSQFQSFMDKYNVVHSDSTLNTAREAFEYGNQKNSTMETKQQVTALLCQLNLLISM